MPSAEALKKKKALFDKVHEFLQKYHNIIVTDIKDLPTDQIQKMRKVIRENSSESVCGKSTVIKKAIVDFHEKNAKKLPKHLPKEVLQKLENGLEHKQLLIVFTNKELGDISKIFDQYKMEKQAKPGQFSPIEVTIPAGPTGMDSSQIEYFQALKIPTKVVKNQLEITSATKILTVGQKISLSEINLMKKFNIKPFKHVVNVELVFLNGKSFGKEILKITPDYMKEKLMKGIHNVFAFSRGAHIPIKETAPLAMSKGFADICGLSLASGYLIEATKGFTAAPKAEPKKEEKPKEQPKKKEEEKKVEEEEEDVGLGDLF